MSRPARIFAALALLPLAACNSASERSGSTGQNDSAVEDAEEGTQAAALSAGDFNALRLGGKIAGPEGDEVRSTFMNEAGELATLLSYVTCPEGIRPCDPAKMQEGTMFTYVHVVTPANASAADAASEGEAPVEKPVKPMFKRGTRFAMTLPAHGFTGKAGYSKDQAVTAMGEGTEAALKCESGKIVWTLKGGSANDEWTSSEAITFYWQSVLPPAGPAYAYLIRADLVAATGKGPYPAASNSAKNTCA